MVTQPSVPLRNRTYLLVTARPFWGGRIRTCDLQPNKLLLYTKLSYAPIQKRSCRASVAGQLHALGCPFPGVYKRQELRTSIVEQAPAGAERTAGRTSPPRCRIDDCMRGVLGTPPPGASMKYCMDGAPARNGALGRYESADDIAVLRRERERKASLCIAIRVSPRQPREHV